MALATKMRQYDRAMGQNVINEFMAIRSIAVKKIFCR